LVGVLGEPYIYHHLEDVTRIGEDFGGVWLWRIGGGWSRSQIWNTFI